MQGGCIADIGSCGTGFDSASGSVRMKKFRTKGSELADRKGLLSAVKPMVRIGRIGDLQLDIYTNNLKNNDWKHSIHHGVWSFSSHSPVTSLRLAVPHRLGDIESDRLHKLLHLEEDVNRLFTLQKGRKEIS
ncbi:hypothetical protein ACH5RR_025817 [Cinchona calisaya]|uniref:Uncharacterized protein n=1 Tax=Cinchona calisaya TaxID=153742 RepID=A0ABD2Z443_9GENT